MPADGQVTCVGVAWVQLAPAVTSAPRVGQRVGAAGQRDRELVGLALDGDEAEGRAASPGVGRLRGRRDAATTGHGQECGTTQAHYLCCIDRPLHRDLEVLDG